MSSPAVSALLSTILVPVDFSDRSAGAVESAGALAEKFGSAVILLHVRDLPSVAEVAAESTSISPSSLMLPGCPGGPCWSLGSSTSIWNKGNTF